MDLVLKSLEPLTEVSVYDSSALAQLPLIFVLENVAGLLTHHLTQHGRLTRLLDNKPYERMTDLLSPLHHVGDGILRPRVYCVLVRIDALCSLRWDHLGLGKAAAEYGLAMREAVEVEATVSTSAPRN
jgi:hypothetical protein